MSDLKEPLYQLGEERLRLRAGTLSVQAARIEDSPEYWLGKICLVVEMEASGTLNKEQCVSQLRDVLLGLRRHQNKQEMAALQLARAASSCP